MIGKSSSVAHQTASSAAVGFGLWLLFVGFAPRSGDSLLATIETLLLLAILTHVPLAWGSLVLLIQLDETLERWVILLQRVAALAALLALIAPPGFYAMLLALPWLACTSLMALAGLWRLWQHRRWTMVEICITAGLLYLPVGAVWLLLNRYRVRPLDFADIIVLLTAVHFHYTGFILPVLTSLTGRFIAERRMVSRLYPWAATGVVVSTPLIALGITLSPLIEVVGVALVFGAAVGLALIVIFQIVPRLHLRLAQGLLTLSALALTAAITFAVVYGVGEFLGRALLTIPQMVQMHGWTNALGFGLCGLAGWRLVRPQ